MANARRRTQRPSRTTTRMAARATQPTVVDAHESRATAVDWQREMNYIHKDLRDILIISVILFALLFTVGFFL